MKIIFWLKFLCSNAYAYRYLWCFSILFKIVRPISGEVVQNCREEFRNFSLQNCIYLGPPHTNTSTSILRHETLEYDEKENLKLVQTYKKCSRHAHESIKPRLYQTGALEVGAEKKSELVFFISKRALGTAVLVHKKYIHTLVPVHDMYVNARINWWSFERLF